MADDAQSSEHNPSFPRDAGSRQSTDDLSLLSSVSLMLSWIDNRLAELEERILQIEKTGNYTRVDVLEEKQKVDELYRMNGGLLAGQSVFEQEFKSLKDEIMDLRQARNQIMDEDRDREKGKTEEIYRMIGELAAGQTALDRELRALGGEVTNLRQSLLQRSVLPAEGRSEDAHKKSSQTFCGERGSRKSIFTRLGGLLRIGSGRNEKIAMFISNGDLRISEGDPGKAIVEYEKALRLGPRSALVMTRLGKAYLARKDLGKGLAALRSALELDPGADDARIFLAGLLAHSNQSEKALDELAQLAHPENYQLDIIKASALIGVKRYEEAIDLLSKSDSRSEAARRLLARAYAAAGHRNPPG